MPKRGTENAAGFDLFASVTTVVEPGERQLIPTGVAIACPSGTYARIAPRSGLSIKKSLDIGAGVVDADYRGEVMVVLINNGKSPFTVETGSRIAQLVPERISNCQAIRAPWLAESKGTDGIPGG